MSAWRNLPKDRLQKIVLVGIVTVTILGGVVQFYTLQQLQEMSQSQDRIESLKKQIHDLEGNAAKASLAEPTREQMRAFVDAQRQAMATGDPFAWAVRAVSLVAEQNPIHVLGWRPGLKGQHSRKSTYTTFSMNIEVTGQYDQIGAFIKDLENRFPTGELHSLELTGDQSDHGTHHASLELTLLMRPADKPEAAKARKPL